MGRSCEVGVTASPDAAVQTIGLAAAGEDIHNDHIREDLAGGHVVVLLRTKTYRLFGASLIVISSYTSTY